MTIRVVLIGCLGLLGVVSFVYGENGNEGFENGLGKGRILFGIKSFDEESENVIFMFLKRYLVLKELEFILNHELADEFVDRVSLVSECHVKDVTGSLVNDLNSQFGDFLQSEWKLAYENGDSCVLTRMLERIAYTKDIQVFYQKARELVKANYFVAFESKILFQAVASEIKQIYKEIFGVEVNLSAYLSFDPLLVFSRWPTPLLRAYYTDAIDFFKDLLIQFENEQGLEPKAARNSLQSRFRVIWYKKVEEFSCFVDENEVIFFEDRSWLSIPRSLSEIVVY